MPITFAQTATPWQPGGARKAAQPPSMPPTIFVVYLDSAGAVNRGIVDTVPSDDPMPGEVAWGQIVQWVDVNSVR